ncbi:MAG: MurR/RpiR family transcriptional regulator [Tissierellia bacterium]|nr:MurR/RpiR family transcriptional regulator [Tissierellia bacterium]
MKYINIIQSFYPSLSKSEKKVADLVLGKKDEMIYMTLQEVSREAMVGEATILRFCRKIGYDGFQSLKLSIAEEKDFIREKEPNCFIGKVTQNLHNTIDNTRDTINLDDIEKTSNLINLASRVFIYGIGSSGNVALDMQSRLLRFGKTVYPVTDSHYQLMNSSIMNEEDLVIAFSLTGYTEEIIDSISLAKKNKAKIIAITNHILSPLANLADIVLITAGKESPIDGGSISAMISQLYIADLICTSYATDNRERAKEMRIKTSQSIIGKTKEKNR